MKTIDVALALIAKGFSVVPTVGGEFKGVPKGFKWSQYRQRRMTDEEARRTWARHPNAGIGLVCGPVSGNVEVVDVDDVALAEKLLPLVEGKTYCERSQHGKLHIAIRVRQPFGKDVVRYAESVDVKTTGLVIIAPTKGYEAIGPQLSEAPLLEVESVDRFLTDYLGLAPAIKAGGSEGEALSKNDLLYTPDAPDSGRKMHMMRIAGLLRRYDASADEIRDFLEWRNSQGAAPLPESELEEVVASVMRYAVTFPGGLDVKCTTAKNSEEGFEDISLADIEEREQEYLWFPRIPLGDSTIMAGDPGIGKSWIVLRVTADVVRAGGYAIILNREDDPARVIKPRLRMLGVTPDEMRRIHLAKLPVKAGWQEVLKVAESMCQKYPEAKLLSLDPLFSFTGMSVDANAPGQMRPFLDGLQNLAQTYNRAMFINMHPNKNEEATDVHRYAGSIDIAGNARSLLFARKADREHEYVLHHVKLNVARIGPARPIRYYFDEDGLFHWGEELDACAGGSKDDPSKVEEAKEFIRDALADGGRPHADLKREWKARGGGPTTLWNAGTEMRETDELRASRDPDDGRVWIWTLVPVVTAHNDSGCKSVCIDQESDEKSRHYG
jgi:hypothetical protein